jgi:hypothetical protein
MAKKGDCYRQAYHRLMELHGEAEPGIELCHGWITNPNGTFGHAWVELQGGQWVIETTAGGAAFEADYYHATLKVSGVIRYSPLAARVAMIGHGHFGPWHPSFEDGATPPPPPSTSPRPARPRRRRL